MRLSLYDSPDQQISYPECIRSSFHTLTASCRHGSECFTLTMITTSTKNSLHCEVKNFCLGSQGLNKSFHSTSSSVSCWRECKPVQHNLRLPSSPDRGRTKQRESGLKGIVHKKNVTANLLTLRLFKMWMTLFFSITLKEIPKDTLRSCEENG